MPCVVKWVAGVGRVELLIRLDAEGTLRRYALAGALGRGGGRGVWVEGTEGGVGGWVCGVDRRRRGVA